MAQLNVKNTDDTSVDTPLTGLSALFFDDSNSDHLSVKNDAGTVRDIESASAPDASESVKGIAELATQAETDAGTDDTRIVTPLKIESSERFDQFKSPLCTGWKGAPPVLSINGGDNTKFDMTAGVMYFVDSDTSPVTVTEVTVSSQTAVSPTFLATKTSSFISINSVGTIQQRSTQSTPEQRRDFATVGIVSHPDNIIIDAVLNQPTIVTDVCSQLGDLIRALGFFSTSGNQIAGITSSLTISKSSGTGFSLSENAAVNTKDPHNITLAALSPVTLFQILQDVTIVGISATIDPTQYDNAGTLTAVPANNNATISYIYLFPNNQVVYLFGQEVFSNFADAKDAAGTETVIVPPDLETGALLLARIIQKKNTTDITDLSEAVIIPSTAISSGGASITTLQQAYDISVEPEIETNSTGGALTIRRGSAADTDDVLEVQNGSGTTTFAVTGDGDVELAGSLDVTGNIELTGTAEIQGVAAVGGESTPNASVTLLVDRNIVSSGFVNQFKLQGEIAVTGTQNILHVYLAPEETTITSGAHDIVTTLYLDEPMIVITAGSVAKSATLYIEKAATEATDNYAIYVASGNVFINGNIGINTEIATESLEVTGNIRTNGQAWSELNTLTDSTTIATDCDLANTHTVTLAGNRTLGAPTNLKAGATYIWFLKQDATGTRTLAYNAVFKFPEGVTPTLSTGANEVDILTGVSDGTNVYVAISKEFS